MNDLNHCKTSAPEVIGEEFSRVRRILTDETAVLSHLPEVLMPCSAVLITPGMPL
jgi:hypothetical protein